MAVSNFEALCSGFCEVLAIPPPALIPDVHGQLAFHVVTRGTTVNIVYRPQASTEHIFVIYGGTNEIMKEVITRAMGLGGR